MPFTFRETTYTELWGEYPQETFGQQVSEATRVFLVDWDARQQAVQDFLGYSRSIVQNVLSTQVGTPAVYYLSRVTPDFHPDYVRASDGQPFLFADSVTIEPFGMPLNASGQPEYGAGADAATLSAWDGPRYNKAKLTVHYSTRLYPILNDDEMPLAAGVPDESSLARYVEIQYHPSAEYLTLPNGVFKIVPVNIYGDATNVNTGGDVPGAPGKIQSMYDLTLIWRQVPRRMVASAGVMAPVLGAAVKPAAFDFAAGKVNSAAIWGCRAGTLLCEPMELTPWRQSDGEIVFDVTFHFKHFPDGHNYFLIPTKAVPPSLVYTEISVDGTSYPEPAPDGKHLYDSYPFANLFYGYDFSAGQVP